DRETEAHLVAGRLGGAAGGGTLGCSPLHRLEQSGPRGIQGPGEVEAKALFLLVGSAAALLAPGLAVADAPGAAAQQAARLEGEALLPGVLCRSGVYLADFFPTEGQVALPAEEQPADQVGPVPGSLAPVARVAVLPGELPAERQPRPGGFDPDRAGG